MMEERRGVRQADNEEERGDFGRTEKEKRRKKKREEEAQCL